MSFRTTGAASDQFCVVLPGVRQPPPPPPSRPAHSPPSHSPSTPFSNNFQTTFKQRSNNFQTTFGNFQTTFKQLFRTSLGEGRGEEEGGSLVAIIKDHKTNINARCGQSMNTHRGIERPNPKMDDRSISQTCRAAHHERNCWTRLHLPNLSC